MQDQSAFPGGYQPLPPPPPAAFEAVASSVPSVDRSWLRELAVRQRMAIIAGIANAVGGVLVVTNALGGVGLLFAIGVGVLVIVAAYRLGRHLYNVGIGILGAAAMFLPFAWLVVMVGLCVLAAVKLRAAGIRVGFFGVDPDTI